MDKNEDELLTEETVEETGKQKVKKPSPPGRSLLLTAMQLFISVLFIGAAYAVSLIGGDIHSAAGTWFFDNYNSTIFTGNIEGAVSIPDSIAFWNRKDGAAEQAEDKSKDAKAVLNFAAMPLKSGVITSPFGEREDGGTTENHNGTDIGADEGEPVFAVLDGRVITAEMDNSYGNYIILDHGDGVRTLYAHCSKLTVSKGDTVKAGDRLGLVGQTGDADGAHLHFELIISGKRTDPAPYLGGKYG